MACPGLRQSLPPDARFRDPLWGPVTAAFTGYALDAEIRLKSASGGALSALLVSILEQGLADAVVQTARDPDLPTGNTTVVSRTRAQIVDAASSRYAPSSPLADIGRLIGDGSRYAFVGKPCDVAALFELRKTDRQIAESFPILISFFCAGVPSLIGSEAVLRDMNLPQDEVAQFDYRGPGWPGEAEATTHDERERRMSYSRSWGAILSKFVQHRCKICADGSGVFADIAFADVWEADRDGYPSFDERPGQSLILCRTALGRELLQRATDHIDFASYDLANLAAVQPGQVRRRRAVLARLIGLRLMGQPIPQYRGMGLVRMARENSFVDNARNMLGMMRRAWRRRRARA
ncbi:Coenzyme F420 hydrogenase/dehydrogenase, beta subunit C-terminal domain [Litoreibacter ponti]|nr:Coenzyme F420 hydrogenase/dehydrogenase, beta subunit C-terminal domain [Litoreibacter ponti]